jgi:hypothetical protein
VQHRYECPAFLSDGKTLRALENVTVYDGKPEKKVSLIPLTTGSADAWDMHHMDAYLSCEYRGADRVVTVHALGATGCKATGFPLAAFCD